MKVLMLNGSAKKEGNTYQSLLEVGKELERQGIEYEIFQIGSQPVRDCIGCGQCNENGCVFADDKVNEFVAKAKEADGFVFGTPVYYAHPSGRILSFLDRVFYSSGRAFAFKPAASVAVARRGGCSASFDVLNKYYGICQMPVAGSTYWNMVHGCEPGEVKLDTEGMQTILGTVPVAMLEAISCGAVFMGANTYIGNAPNFMVKAISDENGIKMPSFFGYLMWSIAFLVPVFLLDMLVFFL